MCGGIWTSRKATKKLSAKQQPNRVTLRPGQLLLNPFLFRPDTLLTPSTRRKAELTAQKPGSPAHTRPRQTKAHTCNEHHACINTYRAHTTKHTTTREHALNTESELRVVWAYGHYQRVIMYGDSSRVYQVASHVTAIIYSTIRRATS